MKWFLSLFGPVGVALATVWTAITGGGVKGILDVAVSAWAKSKDISLAKYQAATDEEKATGLGAIGFATAQVQAETSVILAAMTHPVWWAAWALFVFPIGGYNAMIYFVSMFDSWLNVPGCYVPKMGETIDTAREICKWYVRRVPEEQEAWARIIIPTIFGLQTASGLVAGVVNAVNKRAAKQT